MTQPNEQLIENIERDLLTITQDLGAHELSRVDLKEYVAAERRSRTHIRYLLDQLQQTREELELYKESATSALDRIGREKHCMEREIEHVKAERDSWKEKEFIACSKHHEFMDELSAKDKVLEWYGDGLNYYMPTDLLNEGGQRARSILSQYGVKHDPT
jgi:chromosome segregation ATPase